MASGDVERLARLICDEEGAAWDAADRFAPHERARWIGRAEELIDVTSAELRAIARLRQGETDAALAAWFAARGEVPDAGRQEAHE